MRALSRLYPLTLSGTLLCAVGVYLLAEAYTSGNAYALTFGGGGLLLLLVLAVAGRLIAFRLATRDVTWDAGQALVARAACEHFVKVGPIFLPPFFRLHARVVGRLEVGRDCYLHVSTESSSGRSGVVAIPLEFPLPGELQAGARLYICDVFGLIRAEALELPQRNWIVRPPPFPMNAPDRFVSQMRDESVSRRTTGDEEKYYMRQYIPGDRLKDVNWKASVRASELITRISPESPEQSQTFLVELRPYTLLEHDDAVSLLHLSYARSWLYSFVRAVHLARPRAEFRVLLGQTELMVRGAADLDALAGALGSVRFGPPFGAPQRRLPISQRFIFTTPYDTELPRALASGRPGLRTVVFRTRFPGSAKQPRVVRFFANPSADVLPGRWYLRRPTQVPLVAASGVDLIEEALEVRRW